MGGGIRTIEDIRDVLRAGADKVAINTAAIKNPQLIKQASNYFGSSTIVVAIEAIKHKDGNHFAYTDNGREASGVEVISWARRVEELGAGEIILTSVDREGTGQGFDLELTKKVTRAVSIPVVAHGGAGNVNNIKKVITEGKADAIAVSSILHYGFLITDMTVLENQPEGNIEFLKKNTGFNKISPVKLNDIKKIS